MSDSYEAMYGHYLEVDEIKDDDLGITIRSQCGKVLSEANEDYYRLNWEYDVWEVALTMPETNLDKKHKKLLSNIDKDSKQEFLKVLEDNTQLSLEEIIVNYCEEINPKDKLLLALVHKSSQKELLTSIATILEVGYNYWVEDVENDGDFYSIFELMNREELEYVLHLCYNTSMFKYFYKIYLEFYIGRFWLQNAWDITLFWMFIESYTSWMKNQESPLIPYRWILCSLEYLFSELFDDCTQGKMEIENASNIYGYYWYFLYKIGKTEEAKKILNEWAELNDAVAMDYLAWISYIEGDIQIYEKITSYLAFADETWWYANQLLSYYEQNQNEEWKKNFLYELAMNLDFSAAEEYLEICIKEIKKWNYSQKHPAKIVYERLVQNWESFWNAFEYVKYFYDNEMKSFIESKNQKNYLEVLKKYFYFWFDLNVLYYKIKSFEYLRSLLENNEVSLNELLEQLENMSDKEVLEMEIDVDLPGRLHSILEPMIEDILREYYFYSTIDETSVYDVVKVFQLLGFEEKAAFILGVVNEDFRSNEKFEEFKYIYRFNSWTVNYH